MKKIKVWGYKDGKLLRDGFTADPKLGTEGALVALLGSLGVDAWIGDEDDPSSEVESAVTWHEVE